MNIQTKTVQLLTLFSLLIFSSSGSASSIINGLSVHSELGQESFIAGLFTASPSTDAAEILRADTDKQIQVRVLAERLSSRRFKRMWIEGMAINASGTDLSNQSKNMAAFSNMLKVTLTRGDIFAIQRTGESVKILINGTALGTIDDVGFFDLLLRTWIGSVPLSSQFREDLLAAGQTDEDLMARFNSIRPSEERILAVASALKTAEENKKSTSEKPAVAQVKPKISQPLIKAPSPIAAPSAPGLTPATNTAIANKAPTSKTENVSTEGKTKSDTPSSPSEPDTVSPTPAAPPKVAKKTPDSTTKGPAVASNDKPTNTTNASPKNTESILEEDDEEFTAESLLEQQLYISKLKRLVYKNIKYPLKSVQRTEEGLVRMEVSINRDGSLAGVILEQEPEYSRLTRAAIKAVEKTAPFPEFPDSVNSDAFSFSLPIVFRLVSE